jgi:hypothetical protein
MKNLFLPLLILLLLLTGCHVNRTMTNLTQSPKVKYKLQPIPNEVYPNHYIYAGLGYRKTNAAFFRSLSDQLDDVNKRISQTSKRSQYLESKKSDILSLINNIPKDTTISYIISFTDCIDGIDYAIVRTYWWDYKNWRFLVPLIGYFDRWHNYNQCVNRAVEQCVKYGYDGVIIDGDYSTFKLFVVKR